MALAATGLSSISLFTTYGTPLQGLSGSYHGRKAMELFRNEVTAKGGKGGKGLSYSVWSSKPCGIILGRLLPPTTGLAACSFLEQVPLTPIRPGPFFVFVFRDVDPRNDFVDRDVGPRNLKHLPLKAKI